MAQINNSEVIQKLVDELQLYPGKDVIPSELAEKILPVFQVNSEEITVSPTPANIVRSTDRSSAGTTALYTTPSTGDFYLTNVALQVSWNSNGTASTDPCYISVTIDGTARNIAIVQTHQDAGEVGGNTTSLSLNLQNPVLIDQGTAINFVTGHNNQKATGMIIGYTQ